MEMFLLNPGFISHMRPEEPMKAFLQVAEETVCYSQADRLDAVLLFQNPIRIKLKVKKKKKN